MLGSPVCSRPGCDGGRSLAEASRQGRGEVVLFSRLPGCGGKRRLAADVGEALSAVLAEAFFQDSLAVAQAAGMPVTLACAAEGEVTLPCLPDAMRIVRQCRGDMGERLTAVFGDVVGRDRWPVLIGSDTPDLPPGRIGEAFDLLEDGADIVLGPAHDGGFYLIGVKKVHRRLFEGVAWSTETVFARVEANARRVGLRLAVLERWWDVDDVGGLEALERRLLSRPGTTPATWRIVSAAHRVEPPSPALRQAPGPARLGRAR